MSCSSLGASVHFLAVLLIFKEDCNKFGALDEMFIGMANDPFVFVAKDYCSQAHYLGFAWARCFDKFARPHGEEEGSYDEVNGVVICIGL